MMAGMDSQFIANLISGISALATVVAAIYTRRQAIGSKEAKAKAEESHKAALDMRDAAQRSAKAAEEQANQAELARKAAEERVRQAEKLLEQMQQSQSQSQSKIAANLWRPEFQLTHVQGMRYKLQNITEQSLNVLKVVNQNEFFRCDDINQQFNPGESLDILLGGAWEIPLPSNLILQVAGRDEPIHVQIPA